MDATTETETKSQAYHRLVEEGRWNEAKAYRLAQKELFLQEGKSKDDATDLSWQAMIEKFPSPESDIDRLLDNAFMAPIGKQDDRFKGTWFAFHALKALSPFAVDGKIPADMAKRVLDITRNWNREQTEAAFADPRKFLDFAKQMFRLDAQYRRNLRPSYDEGVAAAIDEQLESMPQLAAALTPPSSPRDGSTEPNENSVRVEAAAV